MKMILLLEYNPDQMFSTKLVRFLSLKIFTLKQNEMTL